MVFMQKKLPGIQEDHSHQQPLDSVYVSNQIKQMDILLDENLSSQMNTMEIVKRLSVDVVHMQDNMNDMQELLSSLIENQEVVRHTCMLHICVQLCISMCRLMKIIMAIIISMIQLQKRSENVVYTYH